MQEMGESVNPWVGPGEYRDESTWQPHMVNQDRARRCGKCTEFLADIPGGLSCS